MSNIETLFVTRLYRAALAEQGKSIAIRQNWESSCLAIAG